ncbi:YdeI/OmpD-associated family protein [Conexibacter arvalis]|uniref:Uncharacterized protein YdeI (YjbR/CyaY-like superfamily) n=1 Tax=Conexibacter arvalis TaxID=912552 RepID=A0A840I8V9_9ACTN|nr:YdeI/OmpD-associated family protein [Conexibacter arvalis]MBB4660683.1 uncharacterized protein YdeI (YjbR/CyaY-like superfamily) [Conexibacter arvalis]
MTEIIDCADVGEWEAWLARHHGDRDEVWIRIAKKGSGLRSVTAEEGIDGAICHGWIDGQRRALDATRFLQRYSPRRPRSAWSQVNVERAERLIAAGRMRPPGLAQIEAARADGRWAAAYVSQRDATVPPELAAAFARDEAARAGFESLGKTERYLALLPILKARTAAARAAQVERAVALLRAAGGRARPSDDAQRRDRARQGGRTRRSGRTRQGARARHGGRTRRGDRARQDNDATG